MATVTVPNLRVNQLGFLPRSSKLAIACTERTSAQRWVLEDASGSVLHQGESHVHGFDQSSGDFVHVIDFSAFTAAAAALRVRLGDEISDTFAIDHGIYRQLARDALRFFFHNRSGVAIQLPFAGEAKWVRPAGHRPDRAMWPNRRQRQYTLDVTGGWYDAGDHGKYVVNGGFAAWMLQNAFERAEVRGNDDDLLGARALDIPESATGHPDILSEARWELEFMLRMQVPPGRPHSGMAHHKIHDREWTPLGTAPHEDPQPRGLHPPSTAATLNLAAVAAQAARLWKRRDPAFSERCLSAAELAWDAARANPNQIAPEKSVGGGAYHDNDVRDDFYWAGAELFLTTGNSKYAESFAASPLDGAIAPELVVDGCATLSAITWRRVEVLGKISLALAPNRASFAAAERYRRQLCDAADRLLASVDRQGYRIPFDPGPSLVYPWGSNSLVMGNMLTLAAAWDFTGNDDYARGVVAGMDYLLGRNALGKSYISGYGKRPLQNPHHRFWAHQCAPNYPAPPPGLVAGGPNSRLEDPLVAAARLDSRFPQRCYLDHIEAFSVNEVAINWNAVLAWTAIWLHEYGMSHRDAATARRHSDVDYAERHWTAPAYRS